MNISKRPIIANINGDKTMIMPYALHAILLSKHINIEDEFIKLTLEEQVKFCEQNITIQDLEKQGEGIIVYGLYCDIPNNKIKENYRSEL